MTRAYISFLFAILFLSAGHIAHSQTPVPKEHPRVYLNADELSSLKQKTNAPKFEKQWRFIQLMQHPFARAFQSLILEDQKMAEQAAKDFLPMLKNAQDGRSPLNPMQLGACIYDWCYDAMNMELKQSYISEFKRIASLHEPYFPAQKGFGSIVGHNCEGWLMSDQLPAGLAIYDEDPQMFEAAAKVFSDEFVPARNFFYQAHMHHQGDSYIATRLVHDLLAALLYQRMGQQAFSEDLQYMPYQLLYHFRPDGQQLRSGDTYDDAGNDGGGRTQGINHKGMTIMLGAALYEDPYLTDMMSRMPTHNLEKIFEFLCMPLDYEARPISELPLSKYFPSPMGEMIARTGWDIDVESNDALIQMRIGNYFFGNHQTKDFGTFQIYYKGPLAISSGVYEGKNQGYGGPHWLNYHHQTISKNGLLIYDPDEVMDKNSVNDGGQRWPNQGKDHPQNLDYLLDPKNGYEMGQVTAHAIGPDDMRPTYSYIAGDITAAYSAEKAERVSRAMLTLHTEDQDFPALFFVFDQLKSTQADFKKSWLLHSIQKPTVDGSQFTIERKAFEYRGKGLYGGKLTAQTILPEQANITIVGGKEKAFWVEDSQTNYHIEKENPASEEGGWRIEVSPEKAQKEDLFFHAMGVSSASNTHPLQFKTESSQTLKGVSALDYAVFFNPQAKPLTQADFQLSQTCEGVFVAGLSPGKWSIQKDGEEVLTVAVSEEVKSIFLQDISSGSYQMHQLP